MRSNLTCVNLRTLIIWVFQTDGSNLVSPRRLLVVVFIKLSSAVIFLENWSTLPWNWLKGHKMDACFRLMPMLVWNINKWSTDSFMLLKKRKSIHLHKVKYNVLKIKNKNKCTDLQNRPPNIAPQLTINPNSVVCPKWRHQQSHFPVREWCHSSIQIAVYGVFCPGFTVRDVHKGESPVAEYWNSRVPNAFTIVIYDS